MKRFPSDYAPGEASKNAVVSVMEHTISKGRQSVNALWILKVGEFKVKVHIERDSYDFQSHARGYVWSVKDLQWNLVYNIPYALMNTTESLYHKPGGLNESNFKADYETILANVKNVLF